MTISEFESNLGQPQATDSQREAGAFLDLMGLHFRTDYALENCEEWAATLLGYPSEAFLNFIRGPRQLTTG